MGGLEQGDVSCPDDLLQRFHDDDPEAVLAVHEAAPDGVHDRYGYDHEEGDAQDQWEEPLHAQRLHLCDDIIKLTLWGGLDVVLPEEVALPQGPGLGDHRPEELVPVACRPDNGHGS